MQQSDIEIIFINEAAKLLGISVDAMRARVHRQTALGLDQGLPAPFRFGSKWAWKRADFIDHINRMAEGGSA